MSKPWRPQGAPPLWRLGEGAAPSGAYVALAPGALVPMLPLLLPEKLRGIARERVAERQLVEQLSTAADGFEMQPYTAKGAKLFDRVLVADAAQASGWRKGLRPGCQGLVPDYLGLPAAPGLWAVEVGDGVVRARLGVGDGFAAEPELALALLAAADAPRAVLRLGAADDAVDGYLAGLDVPLLDNPGALKKAGFTPLRWAESVGGVDLKDPPSAVYDRLRTRLLRWRTAVVCGVLALGLWLGMVVLETQNLQADAARDRALADGLVRAHFVTSGPILDVRAQVTLALEAASGPVATETATLPALTQFQIAAPVLTAQTLRLLTVAYRADTGLVAAVEATDFAALDQVIADLQDANFLVEQLDSRTQQSGGVVARLRLELVE